MTTLSGINNCDTVKKARKWLEAQGIDYHFHDFRAAGLEQQKLQQWNQVVGWEALLNRRSTSWRELSQDVKDHIDEASALSLMLQNPTLIKRPVLELDDGKVQVGFKADSYATLFPTK